MLAGIPTLGKNPEFSRETFSIFIPKLKEWVYSENNKAMLDKIVDMCNAKINKSVWLEDFDYAFSLAVAHHICIMDIEYTQSIGADTMAGGIMNSRSVGGISYNYDTSHMMSENPAYSFWQRTGYGNQLLNLMLARGWVGIIISM